MMLAAAAVFLATTGATLHGVIGGVYNLFGIMAKTMDVKVQAVQYLISKKLPINGSVALACVLYCESELRPGSQGVQPTETPGVLNPKGAYGIASWNGIRQARLARFANKNGVSVEALETDLEIQLYFVLNEIANYYPASWAAIRSSNSPEEIIPVIVADYENPADHAAETTKAKALVSPLLAALASAPPPVLPSPPPVIVPPPVIAPAPTGDTVPIATIFSLAAPILETIITAVLGAHGIKATTPAVPPVIVHTPTVPPPAAPPAAAQIDMTQLAALIAKELASLGISVKV